MNAFRASDREETRFCELADYRPPRWAQRRPVGEVRRHNRNEPVVVERNGPLDHLSAYQYGGQNRQRADYQEAWNEIHLGMAVVREASGE